MIINGKDLAITGGGLPNVSGALQTYFQPLSFTMIVKTLVNFTLVEVPTTLSFRGVMQPLSPQTLTLKPEGQRSWVWNQLHAEVSLILNPDDVVTYDGKQYRVMSKSDYSKYGYVEYHLVSDYEGAGP